MLEKIDIRSIAIDHVRTWRNADTNRYSLGDIFAFILAPVFLSAFFTFFGFKITQDLVNILITALSILVGLLLNLLVIIYDVTTRKQEDKLQSTVLAQTFANISFSILLSMITIAMLLLPLFFKLSTIQDWVNYTVIYWVRIFYGFITSVLVISVGVHLLMILKRVYKLLKAESMKNAR